jgi:hypothetical protein
LIAAFGLGILAILCAMFDTSLESSFEVAEWIPWLSLAVLFGGFSGVLGLCQSHLCRNWYANSNFKWLGMSFLVSQLGAIVAFLGSAIVEAKSLNDIVFFCFGSDWLLGACAFAVGFWLMQVLVISMLKVCDSGLSLLEGLLFRAFHFSAF